MKVIIIKIKGGLGNQLFQYALGKNLAIKNKCKLIIDKSLYASYKLHDYSLEPFNILEDIAKNEDIPVQYRYDNKLIRKSFEYLDPIIYNGKIVKESSNDFDATIIESTYNENVYLDGYWQSEKYFAENSKEIISSLTLKEPITDEYYQGILKDIEANNAVSLHIRRGSYTLPQYNGTHGLTALDFYDEAVKHIKLNLDNPKFYIFSDDYDFAKEKFSGLANSVIVKSSADKDYLDIHLMSKCKHNILANSTFSWWGAWLNNNLNKIVIAPKKWYNDPVLNAQTKDLLPDSWIRM
jgi:hypothetical protein